MNPQHSFNSSTQSSLRACWITTVDHLDWPSKASVQIQNDHQRIEKQKTELIQQLDDITALGMNAVILQIKPCADALYQSSILPWSAYLTGQLGKHPGYDPLEFAIEQAHRRGLKLHAWLNPYRVSLNTHPETILSLENPTPGAPTSVYTHHRTWVGTAYNRFVLDPGIPEVRSWLEGIVQEIVEKYDVDAIHFDDYFYYESTESPLNDEQTYANYGQAFSNKADWRRNNTYLLIKNLSAKIKAIKPNVEFGISPAGVWRNKKDDPLGTDTQAGHPNYDKAYADTRRWVQEALIDYIAPQIYWPFSRTIARYDVIAKWWADVVKTTQVRLYIGMALYKAGSTIASEPDWGIEGGVAEIKRQLDLNETTEGIHGSILFRSGFLKMPQTQQVVRYLKHRWHPS